VPVLAGGAQQRGQCCSDAGLQARDTSEVLPRRVSDLAHPASPLGLHLLLEVLEAMLLLREMALLLACAAHLVPGFGLATCGTEGPQSA
jgi:hypothetical protein